MFDGEPLVVTEFTIKERLPANRVRFVATVNGVESFVKTFGDTTVMCTADELKRIVGLHALGCSRAVVPPHGPVLIARYLPDHQRGNTLEPNDLSDSDIDEVLHILWFDVWICNNDRTGTNIMKCEEGMVPIDESAAFSRPSTFRLTPRKKWHEVLQPRFASFSPRKWPPDPRAVTEVCRRTGDCRGASWAWDLIDRIDRMPGLWAEFTTGAAGRCLRGTGRL